MKIWWARTVSTEGGKTKGWRVTIPVCLATKYIPDQFREGGRGEEKGILSSSCSYDLGTKLNILRKNKGNHTVCTHTCTHKYT